MKPNQQTKQLMSNPEYRKLYKNIINKRDDLVKKNKQLLVSGKTHEYQCNCNILKGISLVLEKLPKP